MERLRLGETGESFTGRRMSGQPVTAPLVAVPRLAIGEHRVHDVRAMVLDLGFSDGDNGFDGILGLDILGRSLLTIEPLRRLVRLAEERESSPADLAVPVRVERDGPSVCLYADLQLPSGRVIEAEVDTGSGCLILDTALMGDCGVQANSAEIETTTGTDETGYNYTRRFATARGAVQLAGYLDTAQTNARVMFQDIIHQGLVGADFLDRFSYTIDVGHERIVLAPPAA